MKPESRIVGIDDCPFDRFKDRTVMLVATFYRGGNYMDGVLSTVVHVDGDDATEKIASLVKHSKFYPSIRCVMLKGIAVAGFNVIDIKTLSKDIKKPVVVVMRRAPDRQRIFRILKKIGMPHKIVMIKDAGAIQKAEKLLVQYQGTKLDAVKEFVRITCTHSDIPEPLRIAHLIAGGIARGESRGKA